MQGTPHGFSVVAQESGVNIYGTQTNPIVAFCPMPPKVTKVQAPVEGVFLLFNLLTPEECQQFINITEHMGYEEALVSTFSGMVSDSSWRNNERVMWQAVDDVWKPIWERLKPFIPEKVKLWKDTWIPYGLNERLRFYRYDKEEMFGRHYDGCFPRNSKDRSMLTLIIYLTDDFEGGSTRFYPSRYEVQPVKGMACLFFHSHPLSPEHEGTVVHNGRKYVLRSDVMYKVA